MSVEQSAPRTSGNATASLVLGIAGLFFVFTFLLSILAVVFGYKARDEIRRDPSLGGEGSATAGIILGWVGIAMSVMAALVFLYVLLVWALA